MLHWCVRYTGMFGIDWSVCVALEGMCITLGHVCYIFEVWWGGLMTLEVSW